MCLALLEHCQTYQTSPNIDLLKLLLANEVFRRHLNLSAATVSCVSCSTLHQTDPNGYPRWDPWPNQIPHRLCHLAKPQATSNICQDARKTTQKQNELRMTRMSVSISYIFCQDRQGLDTLAVHPLRCDPTEICKRKIKEDELQMNYRWTTDEEDEVDELWLWWWASD